MAIFGPKPWVNFSTFWTSCFYTLERHFFVIDNRQRHYPGLYSLRRKVGKKAIFWPITWVNPFGKNVTFSTFLTSCFYSLERHFFVLEYRKRHFPGLYYLRRNVKKRPFLHQKNGLTPLERCQFFDFLNFLFLWPIKAFFSF